MTALDYPAYLLHLAVFREQQHPRGPGGKFRKGTKVKTLGGVGKVTRVEGDTVYYRGDGDSYESSRPMTGVVRANAPMPRPEDVVTADDLALYGVHRGVRIVPGTKMSPKVHQEIATAIDAVWDKYPEFQKRKHTKAVGIIWAHSATGKKDYEGAGGSAHIRANPKTTMVQQRDMSSSSIWINDDRMGEEMKDLTNPAGDKKVSAAHSRIAGIVLHEFGHALAYERGRGEKERLKEEFDALGDDWIRKNVSDYAAASPLELQAEAFALVNASWVKLNDDVRAKLEKVVG